MKHLPVVGVVVVVVLVLLAGGAAMAARVEEPAFAVVKKVDAIELRRYEAQVRAVTVVAGMSWDAAVSEGFRRLAGYIFGGNTSRRSMAMTAPVSAQPTPAAGGSTKIAMTAPVTAAVGDGGVRVTFTMPAGSTLVSLPVPDNPGVVLQEVPARLVAVRRFTGFASDSTFRAERRLLLDGLSALGLRPVSEAELARYDPPWTIPFLRRNEVAVEVDVDVDVAAGR